MKKSVTSRIAQIIKKFSKTPILVIGDIMLDRYIWGEVSRISPEAPVPVLEKNRESVTPGGSGNVVSNLCALGADVFVAGIIGTDRDGRTLLLEFTNNKVHVEGIYSDHERPTTVKMRIIARQQQVLRVDIEKTHIPNKKILDSLTAYIAQTIPVCKGVIISDYGKGVICPSLLQKAISVSRRFRVPIMVDPKVEHFQLYKGITCMTPNLNEARMGMHQFRVDTEESLQNLGRSIIKKLRCHAVLITRGEKGMDLFESQKPPVHIPVAAREVFDVTGAGDTVIAVFTLAKACGADFVTAAQISNKAAGIVIGKVGTATVSLQELKEKIHGSGRRNPCSL